MKNYGEYLRHERTIRNLSQAQVAKAIDISQQAISYYEKNINIPAIDIVERLADFYEISIDELIGRDYESAAKKQFGNIHQENNHGTINNKF